MREKTPNLSDIREIFEKKESISKVSKKDFAFNVKYAGFFRFLRTRLYPKTWL
jgi:hypothetical protein